MRKFSIIVPVYNVENYLEQCLDNILEQSFEDYEIILVNDGSTDNSPKICDQYAKKDNRIQVIHKNNEGLSEARNDAIKISTGKYIIFVDSDDWLVESSLEIVDKLICKYENPDIIINRIMSYHEKEEKYFECAYKFNIESMSNMSSKEVFEECYRMPGFWAAAWIFIVNREYIIKNNLYFTKGLLHEDEEWAPRVILNANKIAFNNNCFYCNRSNREGSIINSLNIKKEYDKLKIIDRLIEESKKDIYDKSKKNILIGRCSSLYLGVLKNISLYKKIERDKYNNLIDELRNKKKTLLFSKRKIHTIVYLFTCILGVRLTSRIISSRR